MARRPSRRLPHPNLVPGQAACRMHHLEDEGSAHLLLGLRRPVSEPRRVDHRAQASIDCGSRRRRGGDQVRASAPIPPDRGGGLLPVQAAPEEGRQQGGRAGAAAGAARDEGGEESQHGAQHHGVQPAQAWPGNQARGRLQPQRPGHGLLGGRGAALPPESAENDGEGEARRDHVLRRVEAGPAGQAARLRPPDRLLRQHQAVPLLVVQSPRAQRRGS
mmetsp:Transcript_60718/g.143244  ORF Transcript_60718/g.143244 Transcript_60718/m.143244 type:complete len:218 (+) Transcript_60718:917-1570(+)